MRSKDKSQKRILLLAVRAGKIILQSGGEIYRVEDTIIHMCKSRGLEYVNVFALPSGIFVSVDNDDRDEEDTFTYVKRIKSTGTDLYKLSQVNDFSRKFSSSDMTIEEGERILDEIEGAKKYPFQLRLFAAAMVTSCFAVIFGGNEVDFCVAFVDGLICYAASRLLEKYSVNFFLRGMVCCFIGSIIALLGVKWMSEASYMPIISGCIMLFVPGLAITTSIRDSLNGDMIAALGRITEAVLVAVSLAAGTGVAFMVWSEIGGVL